MAVAISCSTILQAGPFWHFWDDAAQWAVAYLLHRPEHMQQQCWLQQSATSQAWGVQAWGVFSCAPIDL